MREDVDVIVVGSGAAGLTAATVAAREGLQVLALESTAYFGGTTAYSGGGVWIPCNPHMRAMGQEDSRDESVAYLKATLGKKYDEAIVTAFLDNAPAMLDYLEQHTEVALIASPVPDYAPDAPGWKISRCLLTPDYDGRRLGPRLAELRPQLNQLTLGGMQIDFVDMAHLKQMHRSLRSLAHVVRRFTGHLWQKACYGRGTRLINGNALTARLLRSALDAGAILRTRSPARDLLIDQGRVCGVIAEIDGRPVTLRARKGVILASGGFGANQALRRQHIPLADAGWSLQPEGCQGDGIRMGVAAGGVTCDDNVANGIWTPMSAMRDARGQLTVFPHLVFDRHYPGSIVVDAAGRRFVNEGFHYQNFVNTMHRHGMDRAWLIADHTFQRKYGLGMAGPAPASVQPFVDAGYLVRGASLAELAAKVGIDAATLEATVKEFNRHAANGHDPAFHRGEDYYSRFMGDASHGPNPGLAPITSGPFYALELRPGDLSSLRGLKANASAQVLDAAGKAIEGLYVAGVDMNSMMKGCYPGGGSSLGPAMTFGYIAAMQLAGHPATPHP